MLAIIFGMSTLLAPVDILSLSVSFNFVSYFVSYIVHSCPAAAQGEAGETAHAGRAVVQSSWPLPHAFCLDGHSPSQHSQQCGRTRSVRS